MTLNKDSDKDINTILKTKSNKQKTKRTPNQQSNQTTIDKDLPIKKLNMDEDSKNDRLANHSIKNYDNDENKNNYLNSSTKANTFDSNKHDTIKGINIKNRDINNTEIDSNVNSGHNRDNNLKLIGQRISDDEFNRINNNKSIWEKIDDYFSCNGCSSVCNEQFDEQNDY